MVFATDKIHFMTISSRFFAKYFDIFHKTEVQMVILRWTGLDPNWLKSYNTNRKYIFPFQPQSQIWCTTLYLSPYKWFIQMNPKPWCTLYVGNYLEFPRINAVCIMQYHKDEAKKKWKCHQGNFLTVVTMEIFYLKLAVNVRSLKLKKCCAKFRIFQARQ